MSSLRNSVNSEEKVLLMEMKRFPNSYRDTGQEKDIACFNYGSSPLGFDACNI
jgi:hypothetical protein